MSKQLLSLALFLIAAFAPSSSAAQTPAPQAAKPAAGTTDVDSLDHIMSAVYDVISGPAGPRDWDRFRSLFAPGAKLIPIGTKDGITSANFITPDEYVEKAGAYFAKEGFFETTVSNRVETWGQIAHVWSTYESRHAKGDKPFQRGINSFQLFYDGHRWWVLNISWQDEDASRPIPEKYLTGK